MSQRSHEPIRVYRGLNGSAQKTTRKRGRRRLERSLKDVLVIEVSRLRLAGGGTLGALDYYASSSNVIDLELENARWTGATCEAVKYRLTRQHGREKGRVIYAYGEDWQQSKTCYGVATYHYIKAGTLALRCVDTATDYPGTRGSLVAALLLCAQRIARETGDGNQSVLTWNLTNPQAIKDAQDRHQFKKLGHERQATVLRRAVRYAESP